MKRKWWLWAALSMGVIISMACSFFGNTVGASPTAEAGAILFRDDFSDPKSGWDTWNEDGSQVAYEKGGLRFVVNRVQYDYWSRPGRTFEDARIAVQVTKLGGPDNNDFGIICRYRDQNNFYAFLISSDGYAGIAKVKEGQYQVISGDSLEYIDVIRQGSATNYLGVDCKGSSLILYANKFKLLEARDSDFAVGEVGLIVGAYQEGGVDILFDNFTVSQP